MKIKTFCLVFSVLSVFLNAEIPIPLNSPGFRNQLNNTTRKITGEELIYEHKVKGTSWLGNKLDVSALAGKKLTFTLETLAEQVTNDPKASFFVQLHYKRKNGTSWIRNINLPMTQKGWRNTEFKIEYPKDLASAGIALAFCNAAGTVHFRNLYFMEPGTHNYTVTGSIEKAFYKPGEPMIFHFQLLDQKKPASGRLRITRIGDDGKKEQKIYEVTPTVQALYKTALATPGFVMVRAEMLDRNGKVPVHKPKTGRARAVQYGLGAGVEPEKLVQGAAEQNGFDAFWNAQLKQLANVPLKVLEKKRVKSTKDIDVYDVKVSCIGPRPVSGYLTIPKTSKKLPLRLRFDGYSVQSAPMYLDKNVITFSINPHGIENGRDSKYYQTLQRRELMCYGFKKTENQKPETCYFRYMILRGVRAAQYLKTIPEWDGKSYYIVGGSQGAFQATAVTALTRYATRCFLEIPWFCDLGGPMIGRICGWRPDYTEALNFYDTVNFAKRVKCPTEINAGLSDYVCPPAGPQILYNNIPGKKKLSFLQGYDHAVYLGFDRKTTPRYLQQK